MMLIMTQPPYNPGPAGGFPPAPSYQQPSEQVPPYQPNPSYGVPGAQPYPEMQSYPGMGVGLTQEKKSPLLGIIALSTVGITGIIWFITSMSFFNAMIRILGPDLDTTYMTDAQTEAIMGPAMVLMLVSLVGIVGLVLSIVATASNKGRGYGIVGIILAVILPVLLFFIAATVAVAQNGL
ncbi:MAG: DUF3824 domain-containing protein [Propionibacteriaceae bacterium]|nr:DUF3824 domain-containing protein [Propionibacteriaceae bacterium]